MHQNPQFFWNLFAITTELLKETIISGAIYQGPQPMGKWGGEAGGARVAMVPPTFWNRTFTTEAFLEICYCVIVSDI